jgi:alpha-2-macroglobulin
MKNAQSHARRLTLAILALMLGALACRFELPFGIQPGTILATPAPIQVDTGLGQIPATSEGDDPFRMNIELSEGQPVPQPFATLPPAVGDPLTEAEIDQILRRLAALEPASVEQTEFRLPADPLPPPRPGQTVEQEFPPAESADRPDVDESGPLEVLRFAPEGEIPIAPFVSITFDQAMVPLTTLADLAEKDVPVKIEPTLPGTWRWLGTKTLTFEYDSDLIDRLPKATEYRVTIPAGTQSLSGGELAESVTWTFSTPPPVVVATYPFDTPQPLEPLFLVAFDQRIDPAAVLETIQVYAGNTRVDLRLATEEEIEQAAQNGILRHERHPEGRWLAFKATKPFPPETRITVTVGPGTPSAEGPLVTSEAQSYSFSTYAPVAG